MEDCGTISDYYDPYSPYEEEDKLGIEDGSYNNECRHLLRCTNCEHEEEYPVRLMGEPRWDEFYD